MKAAGYGYTHFYVTAGINMWIIDLIPITWTCDGNLFIGIVLLLFIYKIQILHK